MSWLNFVFILITKLDVNVQAMMALISGHGLLDTMWKGWNLFSIRKFHCGIG